MVAANDKTAIVFSLSGGEKHDAPEGRKLIKKLEKPKEPCGLAMDRAYEDNETRALVVEQGYEPIVPPKKSRLEPWEYDKELYKRRNEVERLFRHLKGFRRVFTRYEKLDVMYLAFLTFALIYIAIK
jgi:transposase